VVNIAIDCHRRTNLVVALQPPNGDGHVVNHAEAFAMIRKSVMKAAANADGNPVSQGLPRRQDRSPGRQPKRVDKLPRVRDFHFHLLARAECAGLQLVHVLRFVNQQNVLISGWFGFQKILRVRNAFSQQPVADAAIFLGGEDVLANGEVIRVTVDQLEGEHSALRRSCAGELHMIRDRHGEPVRNSNLGHEKKCGR